MDVFTQLFERPYMLHAFVGAIAVGLVCSLLSVVVVLKRMAFIGQGISHAGFGGVGTAALLGFTGLQYRLHQDLIVFAFCLGTAILIGLLTRNRRVESDTAIGILLAATMAWGVLAQNLRVELQAWPGYREFVGGTAYTVPWEAILFGSIWSIGEYGMWTALAMAVLVIVVCGALFKEMLFFTFDETISRVYGVRTAIMHYVLLVLLSAVVVVSIRLVGLILVSALLIVPGATALLLSRRLSIVLMLAAIVGLIGTIGGFVLSVEVGGVGAGASIVAVLTLLFALAYAGYHVAGRSPQPARAA